MQLVGEDCQLFPGISVHIFDGHTPGQMTPFIHSTEKPYGYMSDLIHSTANVLLVWIASYDLYPVTAMEEKEAFLREAAVRNYILFFEHDYYTQCATIEWSERGPSV